MNQALAQQQQQQVEKSQDDQFKRAPFGPHWSLAAFASPPDSIPLSRHKQHALQNLHLRNQDRIRQELLDLDATNQTSQIINSPCNSVQSLFNALAVYAPHHIDLPSEERHAEFMSSMHTHALKLKQRLCDQQHAYVQEESNSTNQSLSGASVAASAPAEASAGSAAARNASSNSASARPQSDDGSDASAAPAAASPHVTACVEYALWKYLHQHYVSNSTLMQNQINQIQVERIKAAADAQLQQQQLKQQMTNSASASTHAHHSGQSAQFNSRAQHQSQQQPQPQPQSLPPMPHHIVHAGPTSGSATAGGANSSAPMQFNQSNPHLAPHYYTPQQQQQQAYQHQHNHHQYQQQQHQFASQHQQHQQMHPSNSSWNSSGGAGVAGQSSGATFGRAPQQPQPQSGSATHSQLQHQPHGQHQFDPRVNSHHSAAGAFAPSGVSRLPVGQHRLDSLAGLDSEGTLSDAESREEDEQDDEM